MMGFNELKIYLELKAKEEIKDDGMKVVMESLNNSMNEISKAINSINTTTPAPTIEEDIKEEEL